MSTTNIVLIAGVHGVSGRAAALHWTSFPGTQVYGFVTPLRAFVGGRGSH